MMISFSLCLDYAHANVSLPVAIHGSHSFVVYPLTNSLVLHPTILVPDLDLFLGQAQFPGKTHSFHTNSVLILFKLFFKSSQLTGRKRRAKSFLSLGQQSFCKTYERLNKSVSAQKRIPLENFLPDLKSFKLNVVQNQILHLFLRNWANRPQHS